MSMFASEPRQQNKSKDFLWGWQLFLDWATGACCPESRSLILRHPDWGLGPSVHPGERFLSIWTFSQYGVRRAPHSSVHVCPVMLMMKTGYFMHSLCYNSFIICSREVVIFSIVLVTKNSSSLNVIENREASKVLINGMILQYLMSLQKSLQLRCRGLTSSQDRWRKWSFILRSTLPSAPLCAPCSWKAPSSQSQVKNRHFRHVSREGRL